MHTILLVEDDLSLARVLQINLEDEGLKTILAVDGEEAIQKATSELPDIILLDLMLPKMDGFEVARHLRKNPQTASIPVVILTAKGADEDVLQGLQLGALDYIVKPFNLTKLLEIIFRALKRPPPESRKAAKLLRVAIAGAEEEGTSLLKFLVGNPQVQVLGVADKDQESPGLRLAKKMGIYTTENIGDLLTLSGLDLVLATKHASVMHLLDRGEAVEIVGDRGIDFLETITEVIETKEERERMLNQKLSQRVNDLTTSLFHSLRLLVKGVDLHGGSPPVHSQHVLALAGLLAQEMRLPKEAIELVETASLLHDIGKLELDGQLMKVCSYLPADERKEEDTHPQEGSRILSQIHALKGLAPAVKFHHEQWDGKGFPDGLRGDQIPVEARIIALADFFSHQTDRLGKTVREAASLINEEAGKRFDPLVVKAFVSLVEKGRLQGAEGHPGENSQ